MYGMACRNGWNDDDSPVMGFPLIEVYARVRTEISG